MKQKIPQPYYWLQSKKNELIFLLLNRVYKSYELNNLAINKI